MTVTPQPGGGGAKQERSRRLVIGERPCKNMSLRILCNQMLVTFLIMMTEFAFEAC
jgi:hypothetical protein